MNKLRNEIIWLKIQINSSYGIGDTIQSDNDARLLYDEMLKKRDKFFKIQSRVLKIKRLFDGR